MKSETTLRLKKKKRLSCFPERHSLAKTPQEVEYEKAVPSLKESLNERYQMTGL